MHWLVFIFAEAFVYLFGFLLIAVVIFHDLLECLLELFAILPLAHFFVEILFLSLDVHLLVF